MCIINGTAKNVSSTQIFVFPANNGRDQITVFNNRVDLRPCHNYLLSLLGNVEPVSMILPFPKGDCEMINGTHLGGIFETLDTWFTESPQSSTAMAVVVEAMGSVYMRQHSKGRGSLKVRRSGSYNYTVVPDMAGFDNVDSAVFPPLLPHVHNQLLRNYGDDFSFLVCIVDANLDYEPIAYKHPMRQTTNSTEMEMFVPTMTEHRSWVEGEWDHSIFTIGNDAWGNAGVQASDTVLPVGDDVCPALRAMVPDAIARLIPEDIPAHRFRRCRARGEFNDVDLTVAVRSRGLEAAGRVASSTTSTYSLSTTK